MKTPYVNLKEKQVTLVVLVIAMFITLVYSVSACAQNSLREMDLPLANSRNAEYKINLSQEFKITAKAVSMSSAINSPFVELKPAMAPGGNRLYFSRLAHEDNITQERTDEDIWFTDFDTLRNTWSDPALLPGELNNSGPNFVNSVSPGGDTLILGNEYLKNGKMHAGLSYSINEQGRWSAPVTIKIKNDYNISDHANHHVSLKQGVIISAIERAETVGERDLYVSFWNGETATEPINMGSVINSDLEESSPFLGCDGKTLFFASKGHNGYGGYDIFMSTRLDESWTNWSEPKNLGPMVNGSLDEEHFIITRCKKYALFSRQVSIHNVDLFRISIEQPAPQLKNETRDLIPGKNSHLNPLASL
jgi:OmpA-OmpF porin, OOP family